MNPVFYMGGKERKKVKGLSKKFIYISHRQRQHCGDSQRERGMKVGGGEYRERNGDGKKFALG